MFKRALVVVGCSWLLAACGATAHGTLTRQGFDAAKYGYRIPASRKGLILPKEWLLDNYFIDSASGELTPKETPDYETVLSFDYDGDGNNDASRKAFIHDLRWIHARHQGVIWIRSLPISNKLRTVDLDVLIADYIDEISGAGYEGIAFGSRRGVVEHRYVAKLLKNTPGLLGHQEAIRADIEVANSEQLKLDPNARWQHLRLVLARGPIDHVENPDPSATKEIRFPVLVIIGYVNSPDHFAEGEADFEGLLDHFEIGGGHGFTAASGAATTAASAAPAAPATAAVAPAPTSTPAAPTPRAPAPTTPTSIAPAPASEAAPSVAVRPVAGAPLDSAPPAPPAEAKKSN